MTPILDIERVTRRWGDRIAVAEASLRIGPGRSVCLVGDNGAGKSTLLALAAGLIEPDEGHIHLFGESLQDNDSLRHRVGYVADRPLVYEALTGRENLRFCARLYGLRRAESRIADLLARVGMTDRADEPAANYSAGMRRRLDLARALLHEPQLLLLDEPATSLDGSGAEILESIISDCRRDDRAVLFTAHDASTLKHLADAVSVIKGGRLREPDAQEAAR